MKNIFVMITVLILMTGCVTKITTPGEEVPIIKIEPTPCTLTVNCTQYDEYRGILMDFYFDEVEQKIININRTTSKVIIKDVKPGEYKIKWVIGAKENIGAYTKTGEYERFIKVTTNHAINIRGGWLEVR